MKFSIKPLHPGTVFEMFTLLSTNTCSSPPKEALSLYNLINRNADQRKFMIVRREFLSVCGALGLTSLGCRKRTSKFDGSVVVVGAGVAGMSVGHLLSQREVRFKILEAKPNYGGRVKTDHEFVDFPIPLGGEWIHVHERILPKIVNDASIPVSTKIASYKPESTYGYYEGGKLRVGKVGSNEDDLQDKKFVNGTWLTFFEKRIVPGIKDKMRFDTPVSAIDYSANGVSLKCDNGDTVSADVAVVTVPPQIIKDGDIKFRPPLPRRKQKAFEEAYVWGGMKVFLQFKEKFYPTFLEIAGSNNTKGQKLYYDAAYGQKSNANVMGLFTVGDQSKPYQSKIGEDLERYILKELDEIFGGAASRSYIKLIAQDWNKEKYIRQAYFAENANWRLPPIMRKNIDKKLYFAGDTYTNGEDWGSVHAAAMSARTAVNELLSQQP